MSKLLIRHELSEANNSDNYGTPAFDNPDAGLMPSGVIRAPEIGKVLRNDYGIDLESEIVATSSMRRTRETAVAAGFRWIRIYSELDEEKGGLNNAELRLALQERRSPEATRKKALYIIDNPPKENILFSHGYLIATICAELGIYKDARFIPKFGELREIPLR